MINRNSPRKSEVTKWLLALPTAIALLSCHASVAAQKTIEWFNVLQCRNIIKFDPKKYDEQRLRNTIAVIFTGGSLGDPFQYPFPAIPIHPTPPERSWLDQYQQLCEATVQRASDLPVIDLPGIESYRKLKLEGLDDQCKFGAVEIRAAAGEPSALRSYTSSAAKCSRFIDPLEGKVDLMTFWREFVNSDSQNNASPSACRNRHFSHEGEADAMNWARNDVLMYGWNNCSTTYLKSSVDQKRSDEMKATLEREFRRRFKIKAEPCSD